MKLKGAVIGAGNMGKNHVRVLNDLENVELVAIADVNKEVVDKISGKYKIKGYTDYEEMFGKEELDFVSIVVPTNLHKKVAIHAIGKGLHILLEKPIASTIEEGKEIINAAKEKGVKLMIGHIERFNPAITELKKRLDNNELGRIYKVVANRICPFPTRISDVGVVVDLSVHDLDVISSLLNEPLKQIYAITEKKIHTNHEDLLCALLKFNGCAAILNIDWLTPTTKRELIVTGEKGMFVVNYMNQELFFYKNDFVDETYLDYTERVRGIMAGDITQIRINKGEPLKLELESFINCLNESCEPGVKGEDSLKALDIALKMIESAKEGKVIDL